MWKDTRESLFFPHSQWEEPFYMNDSSRIFSTLHKGLISFCSLSLAKTVPLIHFISPLGYSLESSFCTTYLDIVVDYTHGDCDSFHSLIRRGLTTSALTDSNKYPMVGTQTEDSERFRQRRRWKRRRTHGGCCSSGKWVCLLHVRHPTLLYLPLFLLSTLFFFYFSSFSILFYPIVHNSLFLLVYFSTSCE